jgi:uncharacterized protein (TIGR00375 family)
MFYADLHVHSKYSRATSQDGDLEHMALWARKKGLTLLGTGDFTHPQWFAEIREKLVAAEPGLFRLRDDLQRAVEREWSVAGATATRFLLQVEISTIYKQADRTRKVHHLIYVPDWDAAAGLIQRLSKIGNLHSDGRPILGLNSRELLEITLDCGADCFLIPAHVWTPWFAVLGSKSGFDVVADCYGDLATHVFALETGLSSDPPMNWRLSQLDRYALVSNSDAHSPPKLGREACVFDTELDYFAIRRALETRQGYEGTVEFFPEEGKYHLDGHRKCAVRQEPHQTRAGGGLCPACHKPLTVGVMHRVEELADRPAGFRPEGASRFRSFVPLPELLGEIRGVGEKSNKVQQAYEELIRRMGNELYLLEQAPLEDLRRAGGSLFAEAIRRMREGRVIRDAGYDGEYGTIRLFARDELAHGASSGLLFEMPAEEPAATDRDVPTTAPTDSVPCGAGPDEPADAADGPFRSDAADASGDGPSNRPGRSEYPDRAEPVLAAETPANYCLDSLDPDQRAAAEITHGPLLIVAGPGTGKTRTLTHRIAGLVSRGIVPPEQCLALTFSRRAAQEMTERLAELLPGLSPPVPVLTFHALGLLILRENAARAGLPTLFRVAGDEERRQLIAERWGLTDRRARQLVGAISLAKRAGTSTAGDDEIAADRRRYDELLRSESLADFDDLIALPTQLLEGDAALSAAYRRRWPWVSVDEYQDIDDGQYRLLRQLVPPDGNLCAIGDPDQSIYGFRGSNPAVFLRFSEDFPTARTVPLTRNYRSSPSIVQAALQVIAPSTLVTSRVLEAISDDRRLIHIQSCPTEKAEAEFVVHTIEQLIGGSTFFSLDSGRALGHEGESLSFNDFAVLYRTEAQTDALLEAFRRSGMPHQCQSHRLLVDEPAVRAVLAAVQRAALEQAEPAAGATRREAASPRMMQTPDVPASEPVPFSTVAERLKQAADAVWSEHPSVVDYLPQLYPIAERCGTDVARFVAEVSLAASSDLWDPRSDRVSLLTLHAAKGLEFPVVFLVGCEDGLLPLRWGAADEASVAEERRLFFVGLTRARSRLYLSHAARRVWRGTVRELPRSPFVEQIQRELLERLERNPPRRRKVSDDRQLELF